MKKFIRQAKQFLKGEHRFGWSGNFETWADAHQKTKGYDSNLILEKVKAATLKVRNGEAVYERDSVLFDRIEYSWPLVASLMWIAAKNSGSLSVIDFGGSLGSSYFQNQKFLTTLDNVKWSVVEQRNFVAAGSREIANDKLKFFSTIEEAIRERGKPDLLLIACTLPYLEKPYEFLNSLKDYEIMHLLIDSTPFNYTSGDRITIQKIHPAIYDASYPLVPGLQESQAACREVPFNYRRIPE